MVTGGTSGVGREVVRGLVSRGARVILVCRAAGRGWDAAGEARSCGPGEVEVSNLVVQN